MLKTFFLLHWASFLLIQKHINSTKDNPDSVIQAFDFWAGLFRAAHRWGQRGGATKKAPLPKICHTYPAMMKLGTVIPYLKKTQKLFESHDTPLELCWNQHFFIGNHQTLLYQNTDKIPFRYIISNYFNFFWVFKIFNDL